MTDVEGAGKRDLGDDNIRLGDFFVCLFVIIFALFTSLVGDVLHALANNMIVSDLITKVAETVDNALVILTIKFGKVDGASEIDIHRLIF